MSGSAPKPVIPEEEKKKARIEIIPLIDVVFFLLATFVLFTLSLNKSMGLSGVVTPKSETGEGRDRFSMYVANLILVWKGLARATQSGAYADGLVCDLNATKRNDVGRSTLLIPHRNSLSGRSGLCHSGAQSWSPSRSTCWSD